MKPAALLFDMDGVLIDSEPFWRKAEVEVFARVGLHLTEDDCRETTGLRIDEVVALRHAQQPWVEPDCAQVSDAIVNRVIELVSQEGVPMLGVPEALNFARQSGLPMAIASSSSYALIDATLKALNLEDFFPVRYSAQDEPLGKPHPGVYLQAARKLNVSATACLAIEDSLNGLISAKAARMAVAVVPDPHHRGEPRFCLADYVLDSLLDFAPLLKRLLSLDEGGR